MSNQTIQLYIFLLKLRSKTLKWLIMDHFAFSLLTYSAVFFEKWIRNVTSKSSSHRGFNEA